MFELTFEDTDNSVIEQLMVSDRKPRRGVRRRPRVPPKADCLIKGEVTSIEGEYHGPSIYTIIRGYEKSHRLQRSSRTRTFVDMTDSDIAAKIAREAGFIETDIGSTDRRPIATCRRSARPTGTSSVAAPRRSGTRSESRRASSSSARHRAPSQVGAGSVVPSPAPRPATGRRRSADAHVPAEPAVVPTATQRGEHSRPRSRFVCTTTRRPRSSSALRH